MRIASSTGSTKILPSPTSPVRACLRIVSTTTSLSLSSITTSSLIFGRTLTVRVEPRYRSTMPFWRPEPLASMIDRDGNPLSSNSARIGSNASWRMYASIFFMRPSLLGLAGHRGSDGRRRDRRRRHAAARRARRVLRLRDELLRVPVHPVLGDVEAGVLFLRRHPQPDRLLDREEDPVGGDEDAGEGDRHSQRLGAELVEGAAVPEARIADFVQFRQARGGEDPARERAPDAGEAVGRESADRVVDDLLNREDAEDDDDAGHRADDRGGPVL